LAGVTSFLGGDTTFFETETSTLIDVTSFLPLLWDTFELFTSFDSDLFVLTSTLGTTLAATFVIFVTLVVVLVIDLLALFETDLATETLF